MPKNTFLELLAPAKNLEYGITAINYGADAVYIGAPKFGARANAGNSLADIEKLVSYAHIFKSKVFATLNTLLFDNELDEVQKIIKQLYNAGIDALIIQDMGILELGLPPIPLHASTQCHNASVEKILFLEKVGFQRVVLARELSIKQMQQIRKHTNIELEAFIHGALCVCYSGQCYMSQALTGRSGNRGVCSQPCRSVYDLMNASGKLLKKDTHLLSLKDLNASASLQEMIEAGITSFKIEGRLKDIVYLKNITAYYRTLFDTFLENNALHKQVSSGKTIFFFQPDPEKTFNRSYTSYFLEGRTEKVASFLTQKSIGKKIGKVEKILSPKSFAIETEFKIYNGDGLCFVNQNGLLEGFLVNKVEQKAITSNKPLNLKSGMLLYRNQDIEFERLLQQNLSERKINISLKLGEYEDGFELTVKDEDNIAAKAQIAFQKEISNKNENNNEQIIKQLSKLGETVFTPTEIVTDFEKNYFLPISLLNQLRRKAIESLIQKRLDFFKAEEISIVKNNYPYISEQLDFSANITNEKSVEFYQRHGIQFFEYGLEKQNSAKPQRLLMTTKHCIKYELEQCPVHFKQSSDFAQQLFLCNNGKQFALDFDCKACQMLVKSV